MNTRIQLPPPCIQKPVSLWSGKQIFNLILRPNSRDPTKVNIRTKGKNYTKNEELCYKDSFLVVRNSELLAGSLDKSTVGSGSKNNIFYVLLRDYSEDQTIKTMWKLARLTSYFMMNRGFSIGIGDVTPGNLNLFSIHSGKLISDFIIIIIIRRGVAQTKAKAIRKRLR